MITLLIKFFGKKEADARQSCGMICGLAGIALNLLLCAGKLAAGFLSGSIAVTADAFNNLSDAASSLISLLGFKLAAQKPDEDHPFGHGRFEYIAGLLVAMIIVLMGVELVKSSVGAITAPEPVVFSPLTAGILIASILVKVYMAAYNRAVGRRIRSETLLATATDSLSDCLATAAVLVGMLVARFTGWNIDGWLGLVVAGLILLAGYRAAKDTISPLLGNPPDPEFVEQIADLVLAHEEIIGLHDLVVHDYGPGRVMISLHAEVPADGDLLELHDVADNVEFELRQKLGCAAVVHMDPIVTDDECTNELRTMVYQLLREMDERLSMHDFRIVKGRTHTNLIFDVLAPHGFPQSDEQLAREISRRVKQMRGDCNAVVRVDKPMSDNL